MTAFPDIVALARAVCSTRVGLLTLVGENGVWCAGADDSRPLVELGRTASAGATSDFFEHRSQSLYCAGLVLLTSRGELVGHLCVFDAPSHPSLTDEGKELLRAVGRVVMEQLAARSAATCRPLGHLAGGLAHDMNNALQTIVGALSTVEKLIVTHNVERAARFLGAAHRSARRAGELTGSLQRLARRKSDGAKLLELNSLVRSMENLFERIGGEGVTLRLELAAGPVSVFCDPGELETVLLNLSIDAVQAAGESGEITISTREAGVGVGGPQSFQWALADEFARRHGGVADVAGNTVWITFRSAAQP